jgi:tetratricopeptide (TPR) repeat protein
MDVSALWDFDDPAGSESRFRDAAALAEGEDRDILLTQVARALGLRGQFREAHAILDGLHGGGAEAGVRAALERGRLFRTAGDPNTAKPWFESAADSAALAGLEALELDALHMIPLCLEGDAALAATLVGVTRARAAATVEGQRWLASVLNNLGLAYADTGQWDRALDAFEEALAERRAQGVESATFVARWMVAWALRNLGRTDEARSAQLELKKDLAAVGRTDNYVDEELELLGG